MVILWTTSGLRKTWNQRRVQPEVEVGLRSKRACKSLDQELGDNWWTLETSSPCFLTSTSCFSTIRTSTEWAIDRLKAWTCCTCWTRSSPTDPCAQSPRLLQRRSALCRLLRCVPEEVQQGHRGSRGVSHRGPWAGKGWFHRGFRWSWMILGDFFSEI